MKRKPSKLQFTWKFLIVISLSINAWQLHTIILESIMNLPIGKKVMLMATWHFGRFLSSVGI